MIAIKLLIVMLLIWNSTENLYVYRIFKKKHLLFDDRYTKTMCMAATMISSFAIALYLNLLLPSNQSALYLLPLICGCFIGWKFSGFIKAPASLNGIYNGAMGGIMGMMLGAVLQNPAICKIPIETGTMIATNMLVISLLVACIHAIITACIRKSFKV